MKFKIRDGRYNSKSYYLGAIHIADAHFDAISGTGYIFKCHLGSNHKESVFQSYEDCEVELKRKVNLLIALIEKGRDND